jgi:hypothetical protein
MATTTTTMTTTIMCIENCRWHRWQQQDENKKPKQNVMVAIGNQLWLLLSFCFLPMKKKLMNYYLAKKMHNGCSFFGHAIAKSDLNKCEP